MSVWVSTADGGKVAFEDADGRRFSYRTTNAGVLRVITLKDGQQNLVREFSPVGWASVEGERYPMKVGDMPASQPEFPAQAKTVKADA